MCLFFYQIYHIYFVIEFYSFYVRFILFSTMMFPLIRNVFVNVVMWQAGSINFTSDVLSVQYLYYSSYTLYTTSLYSGGILTSPLY